METFPTKLRAQGVAYCFLSGRLASAVMPFILTFVHQWLGIKNLVTIGIILGIGTIAVFRLEEKNMLAANESFDLGRSIDSFT